MYHLVRSLYLTATSKPEYSVLLLGLDNAGKSTLLNQIKSLFNTTSSSLDSAAGTTGDLPASATAGNTVPTVGQNVATLDLGDMYLRVWDVGGQLSLRRLWMSYYKSANAVVFVVDSTDLGDGGRGIEEGKVGGGGGPKVWHARRKSAGFVQKEEAEKGLLGLGDGGGRLDECQAVLESVLESEDMAGIPVLVLANKQDREDCLEVVMIKEGFVRRVFEGEKGGLVRDSRVLPVSALKGTGVKEAVEWIKSRVVWNKEGRPPVMR